MRTKIIAYMLCVTEVGKEHEIAEVLGAIKGVISVEIVYGEFDIVTKLEGKDLKALDETITTLRKTKGIIRTMTLISG